MEFCIQHQVSRIEHPGFGFQPNDSNPSCAVETDGHILTFDDDGHFADTVGMF
jgi:hypothetical protein